MRAQASVVVTSATAKFLVVRKDDKNFLDAYLKGCIDRAVLEEDFFDYDRPLPSFEDVQTELARKRGYRNWKHYYEDMIRNENRVARLSGKMDLRT